MNRYTTEPYDKFKAENTLEDHWLVKGCRWILPPLQVVCWVGLTIVLGLFMKDHLVKRHQEADQFDSISALPPMGISQKKVLPELTREEYRQIRDLQVALDSLRQRCYLCYDKLIDYHIGGQQGLTTLLDAYEQQEKDKLQGIASGLDSLNRICPACYAQLVSGYAGVEDSLKQIITRHQNQPIQFNSHLQP